MKKLYTVFILLCCINTEAQFGPVNYVDTPRSLQSISDVHCADFNNDGLPDILSTSQHFPNDSIRLFINTGSQYLLQTLALDAGSAIGRINAVDAADIDQDGRADIALAWANGANIGWFQNTGSGFTYHVLGLGLDFTTALLLRDFDNNGLTDLLALQHTDIVLYLQNSPGNFSSGQVIHGGTEFYAISAGYYNSDSLLDVAVASGGFEVLLNDGGGQFTLHSQAGLRLCFGLQSGDLDGDRDVDIAAYETLNGIMFYANDGTGHFDLKDTLLLSTDNFEVYGIQDLDCDGDQDLYTSIPQLGRIVWVENLQDTGYSQPHIIHTQASQLVKTTAVADLNADGKPDIVWGNRHLGINLNSNPCPLCVLLFDAGLVGSGYQWQVDTGSGFTNIVDDGIYSGSNSAQLQLTAAPTSWYGYQYRCLVDAVLTSTLHTLKFEAQWTGAVDSNWELPANWNCGFLPDADTDVLIPPGAPHYPQLVNGQQCRSIRMLPAANLLMKNGAVLGLMGRE